MPENKNIYLEVISLKKTYQKNIAELLIYTLVISSFYAGLAGASPTLIFDPSVPVSIGAGDTDEVSLSVDKLPEGLSGYELRVDIDESEVAEIVDVTYPSWTSIEESSSLPGASIYIKAVDASSQIQPGAVDTELAILTLKGLEGGSTGITVTVSRFDDDDGDINDLENAEYAEDDSSQSSSSSGSGGSSISSTTTTGEKYENILLKEIQSFFVSAGAYISYEFKNEYNAISYIRFDSLKDSGTTQATIEILKSRSSFADSDAPGEIYQQMNIWVGKTGFATRENIDNSAVGFSVDKTWIAENNLEKNDINLYRYADGAWTKLITTVTDEDATYVYFESQTSGFSPFAIIGEAVTSDGNSLKSVDDADEDRASDEEVAGADATLDQEPGSIPGFETVATILVIAAVAGIHSSRLKNKRN